MATQTDPTETPWFERNRTPAAAAALGIGLALLVTGGVLLFRSVQPYSWGFAALIGGAIFGLVGLYLITRPAGVASDPDTPIYLQLALGGGLGLVTTVLGFGLLYEFRDPLVSWVETGSREGAKQPVLAVFVLLVGLGLMFVSLQPARARERQNPTLRRTLYGYNAALTGLLLLIILVTANVAAAVKVSATVDMTQVGEPGLNDTSRKVIEGVQQPLKLTLFAFNDGGEAEQSARRMRRLMEEARDLNPRHVSVEFLSPGLDKTRLDELVDKYSKANQQVRQRYEEINRDSEAGGGLFVAFGDDDEKAKVTLLKVSDFRERSFAPGAGSRSSFKGEDKLISEVRLLTDPGKPVIYFTQDAGEYDQNERGTTGKGTRSVQAFQERLIRENFECKPLKFADRSDAKIPEDAAIVAVVGPRAPFPQKTIDALKDYMDNRKGKLLVLLEVAPDLSDPAKTVTTGLEPLLEQYNVLVPPGRIMSDSPIQPGAVLSVALMASQFGLQTNNAVVKALMDPGTDRPTLLPANDVRPVQIKSTGGNPALAGVEYLSTFWLGNVSYWLETDLTKQSPRDLRETIVALNRDPAVRAAKKLGDTFPVAALVSEAAAPTAPGMPPGDGKPRLAVFGYAGFAANPMVERNVNIYAAVANVVRWMSEKPSTIGIPASDFTTYSPKGELDRWQLLPLLLILVGVLGLGAGVYVVRAR